MQHNYGDINKNVIFFNQKISNCYQVGDVKFNLCWSSPSKWTAKHGVDKFALWSSIPLIVPEHAMRMTIGCYFPVSNPFDQKQEPIRMVIRSLHWLFNSLAPNRCGNNFIFQNHLYIHVSYHITIFIENGWFATK